MKSKHKRKLPGHYFSILIITLFSILLLPSLSQSDDGHYIGAGPVIVDVNGDFDGSGTLTSGSTTVFMPTLDTAIGMKFMYGYKGFTPSALELSYIRSEHDGQWLGTDYSSKYRSYNIDLKYFPTYVHLPHSIQRIVTTSIQPRLVFGISYHTITIEDGTTDGFITKDVKITGSSIRLGAGLEFTLSSRFSIEAVSIFRVGNMHKVYGIVDGEIGKGEVNSNGFTHSLEAKYWF